MKKGLVLILIISIFIFNFVIAESIGNSLHVNIQTTNSSGIATGTFAFGFNISTSSDCAAANTVYASASSIATDSRGIISHYLDNVNLNFSEQYWLCYYRDNVLINASKIARSPYAFNAKNTTLSGLKIDADLALGGYNLTTRGGWANNGVSILGGDIYAQTLFVYNITSLSINNLNINGSLFPYLDNALDIGSGSLRWQDLFLSGQVYSNGTGNNYFLGNLGIGTASPSQKLDVRGSGNFSGTVYINNATDLSTITGGNASWNQSFANSLYAPNTTAGIQYLINGTTINFNRLGIGTSSPIFPLQINLANFNTGLRGIAITNNFDGNLFELRPGINEFEGYLSINTSTANEPFAVTTSGKVGIGTINPSQTLDVRGQGNFSGTIFINNATDLSTITGGNSSWNQSFANSLYAPNTTAGIQYLINGTIINLNRLGINTTTPSTTLMVAGIGPNGIDIGSNGASSGELFFSNETSGKSFGIVKIGSRIVFTFGATPGSGTGSQGMAMTDLGRVGIGPLLNNPAATLEISKGGLLGESVFELNVSGTLYVNGTAGIVGINTANPVYSLEIANSATALNVSGNLYANTSGLWSIRAITAGDGLAPKTWNHFGSGTKDNAAVADSDDVYISDDLEVDGQAFIATTNTTTGTYWNVGDLAEILTTINGRNAWLCRGKPNCIAYSKDDLDFGDVVCIDTRYGQVITICNSSNSNLVAGVVSNTALINMAGDIEYGYPVSIAGLVNTKVSNENGGIYPGDLLVSASKPGYAMKAPENYKAGTILGKSYDFCDTRYHDECVIPMFVALG